MQTKMKMRKQAKGSKSARLISISLSNLMKTSSRNLRSRSQEARARVKELVVEKAQSTRCSKTSVMRRETSL